MKHVIQRCIDLGDFGQHEAEVVCITGEFPYVSVCDVIHKGELYHLAGLMPQSEANIIIEECQISERKTPEDMADWKAQ